MCAPVTATKPPLTAYDLGCRAKYKSYKILVCIFIYGKRRGGTGVLFWEHVGDGVGTS